MGITVASVAMIIVLCVVLVAPWPASATVVYYDFTIGLQTVTRLCQNRTIVTVNGQLPGPTISVREGDTFVVHVVNNATYNITLHWHGIKQWRSCWADGAVYITQCPIAPGTEFTYRFLIRQQQGTLWWHAHGSFLRATVYGALIIYPPLGKDYPFPNPAQEIPLMLGEWWNPNPVDVLNQAFKTGGVPNDSNAFTINGNPGDFYSCSLSETSRIVVETGKTYLLRLINAAVNNPLFFSIAEHQMKVVAVDASYTVPYNTSVVLLYPGQTTDILLEASKYSGQYYIAAHAFSSVPAVPFVNITTTAILQYKKTFIFPHPLPIKPVLPAFSDTQTAYNFSIGLRSLNPSVPKNVDEEMFVTSGVGILSCLNNSCAGPNGGTLVGSMNNISFVLPKISMLEAKYYGIDGVFTRDFPDNPPFVFNYTSQSLSPTLLQPEVGTKVKVLKFNTTVQIVFQNTAVIFIDSHPIHVHGYDFYIVGQGFGNYDPQKDPANFNLVNPPQRNTIGLPTGGWVAVRFTADNPGVWLVHCHLDIHSEFGLAMALLVEDGAEKTDFLPPPPPDLPKC